MASVKAYVGNLLKVADVDQFQVEGIGLFVGQEGNATFSWQTDGIALGGNVLTVQTAIRDAVIAGSEAAGNDFGPGDSVMLVGVPTIL